MTTIYYVYAYIRKSNNTPYYIGKGKGRRAFEKHGSITVPKNRNKIVFLEKNLSEIGALAIERRFIKWYGRQDLKTGILRNKTDGGDGTSGSKKSVEFKLEVSKRFRGRVSPTKGLEPWNKGKSTSSSTKQKISESLKGKNSWNKGIPHKKIECPYCKKIGGVNVIKQWHFENCKFKNPQQ
jgi:hypothetical protein